jgi:MFS family permease
VRRRQLALICSADFLVWLGSGAVYPYLPVFLREDAGASLRDLGLIAGAFFAAVLVFSLPAGRLSDRIGRKPMIVAGTALYAVSTALFLTTREPLLFVLFRALEGLGAAAVVPAAQAFVAEITTDEHRSRAYGWLTSAQYGGLIAGPAAAWSLYALGGGEGDHAFYAIFVFGALTAAAATVALAALLHEPERASLDRDTPRARPPLRSLITRPIAAVILVVATAEFAMGGFEVVWSIYLRSLGASITVVGLTWVLFSAPLLLSFAGGQLADRHSRFALMTAGFAVQGVCWLLVPVFHDPSYFLALLPLDGLAFALAFPAKQAFLVQLSPARWLGSIQGAEQAAMQVAALAGTATAPALYARLGGGLFAVAGAVALLGLVVAVPTLGAASRRLKETAMAVSTTGSSDGDGDSS